MRTANYRRARGEAIAAMSGQIRRTGDHYTVLSQTEPNTKYTLERTTSGWNCSCPDDTAYCKHAYALEVRLGSKARADRGMMIYQDGGQVERVAPDHYLVKSQSSDQAYEVRNFGSGWMCSCPDHLEAGSLCKHIQAVEFQTGAQTIIEPPDHATCWYCDSPDIIRKGTQRGSRRFRCRTCKKYFTDRQGFDGMRHAVSHITIGVEMLFAGLSSRKTANALRVVGCTVSYITVQNWAKRFGDLLDTFLYEITPHVGEDWRTDEVYVRIRGERKYLFAMLDAETRYWLARLVATHKGTDDVRPMFRKAKKVAGKTPSRLISDGASNFAEAHKDEYAPRNFLWKDSVHESHIRMNGDLNNNQMESFNGNTIRMREKVIRGLKKEDSAMLAGLHAYYNHIRQHLGLPGGWTPGEAAGIYTLGENKWCTLIRAAAKAAATGGA